MDKQNESLRGARESRDAREYYTIDVLHIFRSLWHRAWIIAVAGFLAAVIGFSYATFFIAPTYSSSIMLYVNNNSFSVGGTSVSISSSQIVAAQSLVRTYSEILMNRTTLERVIDKADVPYTYEQIKGMITPASSNDTEIMIVTVVAEDPYVAAKIANCIAEVLPVRISEIIDGASMEVRSSGRLHPVLQTIPRSDLFSAFFFPLPCLSYWHCSTIRSTTRNTCFAPTIIRFSQRFRICLTTDQAVTGIVTDTVTVTTRRTIRTNRSLNGKRGISDGILA